VLGAEKYPEFQFVKYLPVASLTNVGAPSDIVKFNALGLKSVQVVPVPG
jgi:hypothetical protein